MGMFMLQYDLKKSAKRCCKKVAKRCKKVAKRCLPIWIPGWLEKFSETSLQKKLDFYSHLSMEDITDSDYTHAKRSCKFSSYLRAIYNDEEFFFNEFLVKDRLAFVHENVFNIWRLKRTKSTREYV